MNRPAVVLDTNVFVAAGFNPRSSSARILQRVRDGVLRMVWNEGTQGETRAVLRQIPPLSWNDWAGLFREEDRFEGKTDPSSFDWVPDPDDRKFAALAEASSATLVTNDDHLLARRELAHFSILSPGEFWSGQAT